MDILKYNSDSTSSSSSQYYKFSAVLYDDGLSVKNITIMNFCNFTVKGKVIGCGIGSGYTLDIDWIKNPDSQLGDISSTIIIDILTKEGWYAERGVTPPVNQLFSQLIPVSIIGLFVRPAKPD